MHVFTRGAARWAFWLLLVLAAMPLAPAHAQAVRVSDIEIRGNRNINREAILTAISTKKGDELSPERLERDRQNVLAMGFFRDVQADLVRMGEEARVIFTVTEYPILQELHITGSSIYTEQQIRAAIKSTTGAVFNRANWETDLNAIVQLYTDKGYFMRPVQNLDQPEFLERGILRLEIHELKVGKVNVKWPTREVKDKQGNVVRTESSHKTKEYVVRRELSQAPG